MAILVDINGTVAREGKPIQTTIDYLKTVTEDIYFISGSHESLRRGYASLLKSFGLNYVELILNPINDNTDRKFKLEAALRIPNLTLAIDNNKGVVAMYRDAGITSVFPEDLV